MMQYRDFDLLFFSFQAKEGTYQVWVQGQAPGGNMLLDEAVTCCYDPTAFWDDPDLGIGGLLGSLQGNNLPRNGMFELGRLLADLALPQGRLRSLFDMSLIAVRSRGMGLRLRLHIDVPKLAQLPWEFMLLPQAPGEPQDTDFLALRREVSIVRTDTIGQAELVPPSRRVVRIAGVLSCPTGTPPLDLARDQRAVNKAVRDCNVRAGAAVAQARWAGRPATRTELMNVVDTGGAEPDIFFYSGHAAFDLDRGVLLLEKSAHESDYYGAAQLAQLLHTTSVRLVVLSACETGCQDGRMKWSGVAPALTRESIPAVVANQLRIRDSSANLMAEQLYPYLLGGYTIDEALFQARQAIYQQPDNLGEPDWGALVLYLQADQGALFPALVRQVSARTGQDRRRAWRAPRMQAPAQDTPLLGRDELLKVAQEELSQGRKIYFHGIYGVGKTSLAAEVYRRAAEEKKAFSGGCLWHEVGKLSAEQVLERIAEPFPEQRVAQAGTQEGKIAALRDLLSEHGDLLIGLDDVPDRSVAKAVLEAADNCAVVLNGTQQLYLGKGTERLVRRLSPTLAMQLFKSLADPTGARLTKADKRLVSEYLQAHALPSPGRQAGRDPVCRRE